MTGIPLEIKTIILRELSPCACACNCSSVSDEAREAFVRDLCAISLVWPDTIALIRRVVFATISIRANDHQVDASLRNLCQVLRSDPNVHSFVTTIHLSGWRPSRTSLPRRIPERNSPFIALCTRPLFVSFLSYIPNMRKLTSLQLDNIHFHHWRNTSIDFRGDFRVLRGSSVKHLVLQDCVFSVSAFNAFLGYWEDSGLEEFCVSGISLLPDAAYPWDQASLQEWIQNWDWDATWTKWDIDKPHNASFLSVLELELTLSESQGCVMLMLMDLLASNKWSPLVDVKSLQIVAGGAAMTETTVRRINNLIRRYELDDLCLDGFTNFENAVHAPLYLAGLESAEMELSFHNDLTLLELDEHRFEWYLKSLAAVPPNSRLRELVLHLTIEFPLKVTALGSGSRVDWGILDAVLSDDNLQFESLTIDVSPLPASGVAQLRRMLMEMCFPEVVAKYLGGGKEDAKGKNTSVLKLQIGEEPVDAKK